MRLVFFAALFFLPGVSGAAEPLQPVVITATRVRQQVAGVTYGVTVISSADVKAAPAYAPDDIIRFVPGVNTMEGNSNIINPGRQTVSMLGVGRIGAAGGGSRALVVEDGIPLTNGWGGWVNWSKTPVNIIDRIEVLRGAGSSLYGSAAVGGVINIVTRPPKERAVELDASYGSRHTQRYNGYVSSTFQDEVGVSLDFTHFETDGYIWVPTSLRGPIDGNVWSRYSNLRVKAASLGDGSQAPAWWWRGNLYQDARGHGLANFFTYRDEEEMAGGVLKSLDGGRTLSANAFIGHHVLDPTNAKANGSRTASVTTLHSYAPVVDTGGSLQWSSPLETMVSSYTVGVDVRHMAGWNQEDDYDANGAYTTSITSGGQQTTVGLFGAVDMHPVPDLLVSPSARVDFWRNHDAFQDENHVRTGLNSKNDAFLSPRLGLRYQAAEALALRGAVYRAFAAPTLQQLYQGSRPPNNISLSNPDLGPEILKIGGELGWDLDLPPFGMHATAFWNEISNAIIFVSQNATTQQLQNVSGVRSRGVILETPVHLTRELSASPSYTYTDAKITDYPDNPALEGKFITHVPAHNLAFTLGYDDARATSVQLRGRYWSRRFGNDTNTQGLDPHFVMDLSVVRRIAKNWEVYFDGRNLLDRTYGAWQFGNFAALGEPLYVGGGVRMNY